MCDKTTYYSFKIKKKKKMSFVYDQVYKVVACIFPFLGDPVSHIYVQESLVFPTLNQNFKLIKTILKYIFFNLMVLAYNVKCIYLMIVNNFSKI